MQFNNIECRDMILRKIQKLTKHATKIFLCMNQKWNKIA